MLEKLQPEAEQGFFGKIADKFKNSFGIKRLIGSRIQTALQGKLIAAEAKYSQPVYLKFQHDAQGDVVVICLNLETNQELNRFSFRDILYDPETIAEAKDELANYQIDTNAVWPAVEEKAKQLIPSNCFFVAIKAKKAKMARLFLYEKGHEQPIKSDFKLYDLM